MFQLRFVCLALLSLLGLAGCSSNSPQVTSGPQHGVLGAGASISGRSGDGARWSLAVVENDVRLAVDGAVVFFEQGAPSGELRFEHFMDEDRWVLELPSGTARCEGQRLEVGGQAFELTRGETLLFDAQGRLRSNETR